MPILSQDDRSYFVWLRLLGDALAIGLSKDADTGENCKN
jgi:hypothetical protein